MVKDLVNEIIDYFVSLVVTKVRDKVIAGEFDSLITTKIDAVITDITTPSV